MGKVIKKCLACGTLNQYDAKACKKCESPLLADVDQEDEILSIDPMEAALDDAVSSTGQEDDLVAQILREQAENAKKIVAKEIEKEERKKKRNAGTQTASRFSGTSGTGGSSFGFSLGGESGRSSGTASSSTSAKPVGGSKGFSGFKISDGTYQVKDVEAPGKVHLGGGSLRMQAIRQSQASQEAEEPTDKKKK